jgi:hypothetical protein
MPLMRYFALVGVALLGLLFVCDAYLPKAADVSVDRGVDKSVIRIHSDRKWPERIVFDTNQPTFVPAQAANKNAPSVPAPSTVAEVASKARAHDAFAELQSADEKPSQLTEPKKLEKKVAVRKRTVAKRRAAPPAMLLAQQPQFGFFGQGTW